MNYTTALTEEDLRRNRAAPPVDDCRCMPLMPRYHVRHRNTRRYAPAI